MIKAPIGKIRRKYSCISETQKILAKAYIQDAVHSFCEHSKNSEISVRLLFGGENKNWTDTPLQCIYDYYKYMLCSKNPTKQAAIDVGWLFKEVLYCDVRVFEYVGKDTGNNYILVKE